MKQEQESQQTASTPRPIQEIEVLWLTAGLGCDGESVALTAATQPSIEDLVLGGLPGLPKVNFHNPFYGYENGDEFMPFMDQPPGSLLSSQAVMTYGRAIHALRRFTQASLNQEPAWRRRAPRA